MTTATRPNTTDPTGRTTDHLDITVLLGGPSAEREVSLNSGAAVAAALCELGHTVTAADISPADLSALDLRADLVFIALHGTFGEDGQLQAILEQRGQNYAGSDARASRLAMDKVATKRVLQQAGLPTPPYQVHAAGEWPAARPLPAVVKPIDQGSSVDTVICRTADGFQQTVAALLEKYGRCLVEDYIRGPELTVGIIGEQALPICEIRTPREFYDYHAKYHSNDTEYRFDLDLPADLIGRLQHMSLQAHQVVGCRHFSRVDWMLDAVTAEPYILELNTIPGFTDHSLLPKAAARANIEFKELCRRIVQLARARGR